MIHRTIQGTEVPALGFGTWKLTGAACVVDVQDAIDVGYRHIDTAQMYDNEQQVGDAVAQSGVAREDLFITTKLGRDNVEPGRVSASVAESLNKLGMDYVDLLLIHWPSDDVPVDLTLAAMNELVDAGVVRHVGVSNFTPSLFDEASKHARLFCNQVEYHPLLAQDRLVRQAREHGHLLTAYSPLAQGRAIEAEPVRDLARRHGKTPAQIALRWLIQQANVAAIPRAASPDHRRANINIFDFELDAADMRRLYEFAGERRTIDPEWAPVWER